VLEALLQPLKVGVMRSLQELEAALAAARAETQESVKAGNDNFNRLVAAKLQREAELQEELQQVRRQQQQEQQQS
jgi:hypothetical protein